MRADLHIHTTASDSCWSPEQVVKGALKEGIGLIAVTDHDAVESVPVAEDLARRAGLSFLRGVEISTRLNGALFHIVSYGIDYTDTGLLEMLERNRQEMRRSNRSIIRGLIDAGFGIDWGDYLHYEDDPTRGGFLELNFAIDRGLCQDVGSYYGTLLAGIEYDDPEFVSLEEAIGIIRSAGGVPIVAHPGASLRDVGVSRETLTPLVRAGVTGFECYSQYHEPELTAFCVDYCRQRNLLITGGSDFHGGFVGRKLGVPYVTTDDLVLGELFPGES